MIEFYYVLAGSVCGIIAGLLPGVGVLASLILTYPFLIDASVVELILFYMSLAAMVQFTGTVPSVFLGMPGETNSAPTVIEGTKFTRHKRSDIAVGICALGSVFGSIVAVCIFILISEYALQSFGIAVSNRFKALLYLFIFTVVFFVYNNRNKAINLGLLAFGFVLSMVGESPVTGEFRLTFDTHDLTQGLGIVPVITGILVFPAVLKTFKNNPAVVARLHNFSVIAPLAGFCKHWTSSLRGSIVGFFAGLVPGVSTVLSTNLSYSLESILHKRSPAKKIIACETANNSGQFASMIPLLLFGIPITGSEIFLYNLLVNAGWDTNQFANVDQNISMVFENVLPWFVLVNIAGFLISWPFAKHAMIIFRLPQKYIMIGVLACLVAVNLYVGMHEMRTVSFCIQFLVCAIIGVILRNVNTVPVLFSFLLGNELESVFYREYLFLTL